MFPFLFIVWKSAPREVPEATGFRFVTGCSTSSPLFGSTSSGAAIAGFGGVGSDEGGSGFAKPGSCTFTFAEGRGGGAGFVRPGACIVTDGGGGAGLARPGACIVTDGGCGNEGGRDFSSSGAWKVFGGGCGNETNRWSPPPPSPDLLVETLDTNRGS